MNNQIDIHLIVQPHAVGYTLLSNAYGTFTNNKNNTKSDFIVQLN